MVKVVATYNVMKGHLEYFLDSCVTNLKVSEVIIREPPHLLLVL